MGTQTKSKPLKAYIVQEIGEMTGGVVYAKTNAQARRKGAEEAARRERLHKEWERHLWGRWWFAESIHVHIEPRGFADAMIRLPYLRDGLHMKERDGKHTVSIRDLPIWQRAYTINGDAELAGTYANGGGHDE